MTDHPMLFSPPMSRPVLGNIDTLPATLEAA
jgi:hypothetical protein